MMVFLLLLLVPGTYNLSYLATFWLVPRVFLALSLGPQTQFMLNLINLVASVGEGLFLEHLSSPSLPPLLSQVFYMVFQLKGDFRVFSAFRSRLRLTLISNHTLQLLNSRLFPDLWWLPSITIGSWNLISLSYLSNVLTGSPSVLGLSVRASDSTYVELNQFSCQCGWGFVSEMLLHLLIFHFLRTIASPHIAAAKSRMRGWACERKNKIK